MKRNAYLLLLLVVATFTGCKKEKIEYSNEFEKSAKVWTAFKNASNNSYSYTTNTGSWTGYSSETTLTIVNGKIIGRTFISKGFKDNSNTVVVLEQWQEDESSLNTHQSGASLLTLDQVYELAKNELLLKRDNAKVSFEAKNNGLISSAGYIENGCQDDCFMGINIKSISKYVP
ncbi:hypothetical protein FA048_03885 [Pedobacter polaris]|uniref:Uncharacterized protein n=1 Tax=Pedobacter polaris TaxID=2571273 RepID=A0A4U1CYN2_9SPHI|nr:hypothetical protein [Pedobacter polaris]TKC12769.1 hypothetical protein FA048_03885 [Pedobacter polaris]